MPQLALEVADIFRDHGPAWRAVNAGHISRDQMKVMSAIERCRTSALGGHVGRCENDACGHTIISYNSCRNRHCPKCQAAASRQWLSQREACGRWRRDICGRSQRWRSIPASERATFWSCAGAISRLGAVLAEVFARLSHGQAARADHQKYVSIIDRELRSCGGHSLWNMWRGEGPPYREIVVDVCKKCGIKSQAGASLPDLERALLKQLFDDAMVNMSPKEREEVAQNIEAEMKKRGYSAPVNTGLAAPLAIAGGGVAIELSGFLAYQYGVIIANALAQNLLGQGLSFAANAALTRSIAIFAGPAGWIATGLLTALAMSGPAYRSTMPCVAHIAHLRLQRLGQQQGWA